MVESVYWVNVNQVMKALDEFPGMEVLGECRTPAQAIRIVEELNILSVGTRDVYVVP
jgi:hypothetical protein